MVWLRLEKKSHICLQGLSPLSNTVTQSKTSALSYSPYPGAAPCRRKKEKERKKPSRSFSNQLNALDRAGLELLLPSSPINNLLLVCVCVCVISQGSASEERRVCATNIRTICSEKCSHSVKNIPLLFFYFLFLFIHPPEWTSD